MVMVHPNNSNDAALAAQIEITRDATLDSLATKSDEVKQQYRDEAARVEAQKQQTADVITAQANAAFGNNRAEVEAEYQQKLKNATTAASALQNAIHAPHLSQATPDELRRNISRTTQELLVAQENFLAFHPEAKDDPNFNLRLAEQDGNFFLTSEPETKGEQTTFATEAEAFNAPLDKLRQVVQHPKKYQPQTPATRPVDEPLVSFVDNPDGTFDAKLETGETFKGFRGEENREAIRKLAESKIQTRRHFEQKEAELRAQIGQPTQTSPTVQEPIPADMSLSDWAANQALEKIANQFGYRDVEEFSADQRARYAREQEHTALLEQFKNQNIVSDFFSRNPDYPNSDAANQAIEQIITQNGWQWTAESMTAAHAVAVQHHLYQPLTQDEIAIANGYNVPQTQREVPPPMIRSNNPETTAKGNSDPWTMQMDDLRKAALSQQTRRI